MLDTESFILFARELEYLEDDGGSLRWPDPDRHPPHSDTGDVAAMEWNGHPVWVRTMRPGNLDTPSIGALGRAAVYIVWVFDPP